MQEIIVTPYKPTRGQSFDRAKIALKRADFTGIPYKDGMTVVNFEECSFEELIIENNEEIEFEHISLHFIRCTIGNIEVEDVLTKNVSVNFYHSIVRGRIRNENIQSVDCNNCLLNNSLFISGVGKAGITYSKDNLDVDFFRNILKAAHNGHQPIQGKHSYYLERIKNTHVSSNFDLGDEPLKINVNVSLTFDPNTVDATTGISNIRLSSLTVTGASQGEIAIENIIVNALYIGNFSAKGGVQFYNIKPISIDNEKPKLQIHRSNLDNTWFDNVDFSRFRPVSLYRTKFSKTVFTSCIMPEDYISFDEFKALENIHYPEQQSDSYNKDRYEMFLQLRKAFEATGNYYESQKMQAIAHHALRNIETVSFADRLILGINSISNNHGLSIRRPFWGLLGTSILLYLFYIWSLGRLFNNNGWDLRLFGYYFQFLDLTHRIDFLAEKQELNGWSVTLDFLNKLFAGFFIYQFIAAFRKYGKT